MKSLRSGFVIVLALLLCSIAMFGQTATPQPTCPLTAVLTADTSSGATQVIAAPSGAGNPAIFINGTATANPRKQRVVICQFSINVNQAAGAADYGLVAGTGSNCGTGQSNLTFQRYGTASVKEIWDVFLGDKAAIVAPTGNAVCLKLSAAPTNSQVTIHYNITS